MMVGFRKGDIVFAVPNTGLDDRENFLNLPVIQGIRRMTDADVRDWYSKYGRDINSAGETYLCPQTREDRLPLGSHFIVLKARASRLWWHHTPCSKVLDPLTGHEYTIRTVNLSKDPTGK
jgi:hypothetical protein